MIQTQMDTDAVCAAAEVYFNSAKALWSKSAYTGIKSGFVQFGQSDYAMGLAVLKEAGVTQDEYKLWEDKKHGYVWTE
jgi:hypothetical protein